MDEDAVVAEALEAPTVGPLLALVGTWTGDGVGRLPGQPDFHWSERLEIATPGTPVLSFRQRTRRPDGSPFHAEDGWVRVPPELQADELAGRQVELAVASPTGVLEALAGRVDPTDDGLVLDVRSSSVTSTPVAATVLETRRRWTWDGDALVVDFWMATPDHDLFHHLTSTLRRS